ncbi:Uncharacterized protein conserved in bacteria [Gemella morbillorum]|uniref:DUF1307 domain-containing protein n=2 Tax=Gemella morbillorum TaxID=29391 RepID=A0A2X4RGI6_9BACL|nr:DUF1307 domain-containing protein [Gemella morbillorum]EFV35279.1 hypothetical protein HMPREF0432_01182 [Gemella morbillorum M424]QGS08568.1 DUF1307 domain-containing protein [Gemella morbillorum]UBH80728.1 DUF1307 domain-containing protein [Gemella morbillorum]SQH56131.1 Uncharacterized protein conserved in bacteria [Gemella morbillorum]
MKKLLKLTITFVASIFLLTACSGEKTKTYIHKTDREESEITIYYKDDVVNKLVITNTLKSPDEKSRNIAKSKITEESSDINGVSVNFEEKNNQLTMKLVVDYTKIDFDKAKRKLGMKDTLEEERKLSTSEKRAKDLGAEEKK